MVGKFVHNYNNMSMKRVENVGNYFKILIGFSIIKCDGQALHFPAVATFNLYGRVTETRILVRVCREFCFKFNTTSFFYEDPLHDISGMVTATKDYFHFANFLFFVGYFSDFFKCADRY